MNAIAFPVLSRIALRADHLLELADAALRGGTRIDPALVWADATRIKEACDEARRAMVGAEVAQHMEVAQ